MRNSPLAAFWRRAGIAWAFLALLGAAWAIATPIGGSPDEPAHLIKAASVARGQIVGASTKGGTRVTVPEYIAYSQTQSCFAFHSTITPRCAPADSKPSTALVSAVTSAGLYNPTFYTLVGWTSLLFSGETAIYSMRIVSDLLASLFLGLVFGMIALWRRPILPLIGFAAAVTPMVIFLDGAVNPNSLEITATLATFVGVLSIVREPANNWLVLRASIVFVAASVAANMRGLSLIWVAVALLTPLLLVPRATIAELLRARVIRLAIVGIAAASVAAAAWEVGTNSLGVGQSGSAVGGGAPGIGTSHLAGFAWNLGSTFCYAQQVVGVFGWLDTAAPAAVYFAWSMLAGGIIVAGIVVLRGRPLRFAVVLIALVVLLPPVLQGYYITTGGIIWQGRYILPVFVCVTVGIATVLSGFATFTRFVERRLVIVVLAGWAVAQYLAFATTLKRYAVGSETGWLAILHPVWSPPGGLDTSLIVFALLLSIAAVGVARLYLRATRAEAAPIHP